MTLNCNGQLVSLNTPRIMGILNITPDSFYGGSRINSEDTLLKTAEKMLTEGATFLDLGAYSSRPGADDISESEELKRILPAIEKLLETFPEAIVSVDTFRAGVARKCIDAGASIVNDISGGVIDPDMITAVGKSGVPYCMMHMKGTPQNMVSQAEYDDLLLEIKNFFADQIIKARAAGINDIMLDPGFGFAKNISHNFTLLKKLDLLSSFNLPILVGLSRKSMIYKTLKTNPTEALNGTTALHMAALLKGVHILRVHDVKEAVECVELARHLI